MSCRSATPTDFIACLALLRQLWPDASEELGTLFGRLCESDASAVVVADEAGEVVGLVDVTFREVLFHGGLTMIVEDLIVDAQHRREHVGTRLLRFVEDLAASRRCRAIELCSDFGRDDALRFWEANGYDRLAYQFRKTLDK